MENDKNAPKKSKRILSLSLATAGLLASATAALGAVPPIPATTETTPVVQVSSSAAETFLPQLVLQHADQNQRLMAQHDSHSSHESHASHSSHSSGM